MKHIISAVLVTLLIPALITGSAAGLGDYTSGASGIDVSYPNCSTSLPKADFGIVGVSRGVVFSQNECLKQEASAFKKLSLYMNTGLNADLVTSSYYQTAAADCNGDVYCAAYNYGHNAAQDALNYANDQGVSAATWWLDVETSNTWNSDTLQNQKSLQGAYDFLHQSGISTVGVYSTTAQWGSVTGSWQNNWPSWGATTWTSARQASKYCTGHEFTGGPSYLMQYRDKRSQVDQDYAC